MACGPRSDARDTVFLERSLADLVERMSPAPSLDSVGSALGNPIGVDVSKFTMTASEYIRLVELGDGHAERYMTYVKDIARQCLPAHFAAVRSLSPSESGGSSRPPSVASNGSARSRFAKIAGLKTWRRPLNVPDGLCYSKLLKDEAAESAVGRLGMWPTVAALLESPASEFKSVDDLRRFRAVDRNGAVHIAAGGCDGFPVLQQLASAVPTAVCSVGSLGAVIKAYGVDGKSYQPLKLTDRVGGGPVVLPVCSSSRVPVSTDSGWTEQQKSVWTVAGSLLGLRLESKLHRSVEFCERPAVEGASRVVVSLCSAGGASVPVVLVVKDGQFRGFLSSSGGTVVSSCDVSDSSVFRDVCSGRVSTFVVTDDQFARFSGLAGVRGPVGSKGFDVGGRSWWN